MSSYNKLGAFFLDYCKVCKNKMKKIPFRKLNHLIQLEYYCPVCDVSEIEHVNVKKMKK